MKCILLHINALSFFHIWKISQFTKKSSIELWEFFSALHLFSVLEYLIIDGTLLKGKMFHSIFENTFTWGAYVLFAFNLLGCYCFQDNWIFILLPTKCILCICICLYKILIEKSLLFLNLMPWKYNQKILSPFWNIVIHLINSFNSLSKSPSSSKNKGLSLK